MDHSSECIFTIDSKPVTGVTGQSVLEAALSAGIYIPHLCYHPALRAQGGCKLCTVEVTSPGGAELVSACMTEVREGMAVRTTTENAVHLRQVALELLLACHPADCTSCAVYLNCELQALLQYLGVAHSRLRRVEKQNRRLATGAANPLIKREMERCVQCGRCVRACEELRGVGALAYLKRNGESYVGVKDDRRLDESDCRFCGACVEVCPTGAIQDMPGIFPVGVPREQALVPCRNSCPAGVDIPVYIRLAEQGRYTDAAAVLHEKLTFPHVLGYVCARKCEASCKRGHLQEALSIREIKRVVTEMDAEKLWLEKALRLPSTGKKAVVVGAGPTGLTAAWHLARKGHSVTVLEKQSLPGGMMQYGIPLYRLPRQVVEEEIAVIAGLGVKILTNAAVSSAAELKTEYDAVLIAVGTELGAPPPLKELAGRENVWAAVDFCRMASSGRLPDMNGAVITVLGGGNVAFDCARTAKKAGAKEVSILCLEERKSMLADKEEIDAALLEGIRIINSAASRRVLLEGGSVCGVEYERVKHFQFGPNGLELETEPNSATPVPSGMVIYATGQQVGLTADFGLALGRGGRVVVDETFQSSVPGVFAAGDAVTGTKTIVEAITSGRTVSAMIDRYLGSDGLIEESYWQREDIPSNIGKVECFSTLPRSECLKNGESARTEALRCLRCDLRLQIPSVRFWGDAAYRKSRKGEA
ncbi:MAG: FAD-dependent oxidoreductase [Treponema sp.]|nr:FAD-dependent oxidoreductase [Treponema sp.]